jgi:hypothetical protein
MVLGPVGSELSERLVVVSGRCLQYVPFAALPAPQSQESRVGVKDKQQVSNANGAIVDWPHRIPETRGKSIAFGVLEPG